MACSFQSLPEPQLQATTLGEVLPCGASLKIVFRALSLQETNNNGTLLEIVF
jgi:hypothetical protein